MGKVLRCLGQAWSPAQVHRLCQQVRYPLASEEDLVEMDWSMYRNLVLSSTTATAVGGGGDGTNQARNDIIDSINAQEEGSKKCPGMQGQGPPPIGETIYLSFGDFANMMSAPMTEAKEAILDLDTQLRQLFDIFDEGGEGSITTDELRHIIQRLGKNTTEGELEAVIRIVDYTNDGVVGISEFVDLIAGTATVTQR
jgi:hypothetical protein